MPQFIVVCESVYENVSQAFRIFVNAYERLLNTIFSSSETFRKLQEEKIVPMECLDSSGKFYVHVKKLEIVFHSGVMRVLFYVNYVNKPIVKI